MDEPFYFIFRLMGIAGDGRDGKPASTAELIQQMREDPEFRLLERSFWENYLRTRARTGAEALLYLLFFSTAHLSEVLGGPVPVLLPRTDVNTLRESESDAASAALALAHAMQRLVRHESAAVQAPREEQMLARIEGMIAKVGQNGVPTHARHLDTDQVARRLGVATKTVRRLFGNGQLIGRKLAGGEWRTTEADLTRSPYLQGRRRHRA
jgi:hypothetical protein